ncbi:MAG TPA: VOC family protein [Kofleriaceae bacterium]|jgi:predicted enzyme related to lactoylglutathione lyase|nr:VOC family protein [Kofleriaceae bacterium]
MSNPMIHWELMVNDIDRATAFYRRVFGWTFEAGGPYVMIHTGDRPGGGMMTRPPHAPPALNVYFAVADIDATLRAATEAGGRLLVPRTEIPPGWFAMFVDPDGIPVGILQERAGA